LNPGTPGRRGCGVGPRWVNEKKKSKESKNGKKKKTKHWARSEACTRGRPALKKITVVVARNWEAEG